MIKLLTPQVARQRTALHDRIMARKIVIAEQLAKEEAAHQRELLIKENERQVCVCECVCKTCICMLSFLCA